MAAITPTEGSPSEFQRLQTLLGQERPGLFQGSFLEQVNQTARAAREEIVSLRERVHSIESGMDSINAAMALVTSILAEAPAPLPQPQPARIRGR